MGMGISPAELIRYMILLERPEARPVIYKYVYSDSHVEGIPPHRQMEV